MNENKSAPFKTQIKLNWQIVVGAVAAAFLLGALAVVLLLGMGVDLFPDRATEPLTPGAPSNIGTYVSDVDYTGTVDEAVAAADTVVATMNGKELTNGMLQVYFYMQVSNFVSNNYYYLSAMGFDYTKTLNTQQCYYDETKSWEEYFVDVAITTWQNYQAICMLAEEAGFELTDELQAELDKIPADYEEAAKNNGHENAEAYIKAYMGMNTSMKNYLEHCRIFLLDDAFTDYTPTADELEKYYNDNIKDFEDNKITKESGPIVDVRHILIVPEGGTKDENGVTVYTDTEWAACLVKAQGLLDQWKNGDATEESFAALAKEHSEDGGSSSNGGLYTDITSETTFVKPFLDWCIAEGRKTGDTEIVKTDYGYHIMYFSAGQQIWEYYASKFFVSDRTTEMMEEAKEKWPIEIDHSKLCLTEINFG